MEKRCFACMNKLEEDSSLCTHCGMDNNNLSEVNEYQLAPGSVLRERYFIGFLIEQNGEGITYIAFDREEKKRVRIREFFPTKFCRRDNKGEAVIILPNCEIQYKSLKTDFAELSKNLIELKSNNSLVKAKNCFADNNTLYTIYEDVVGMTLTRYLMDNAGDLSWEETENLFLPLLYTVKLLNQNGIIHRGISPETILVTPQKELKLTGICLSGVRAINSEIEPELFVGYAAPEQYQKCTSYGEWTDVYSLCAVLYKTLTGTMPPRSDLREPDGEIISPAQLNPIIPHSVSETIVHGLAYNKAERIGHVKDLMGSLYATNNEDDEVDNSRDYSNKPHKKFHLPVWLIVILITLPIMLIIFFFMYDMILGPKNKPSSSQESSSMPSSSDVSSDKTSSIPASSKTQTEANKIAVDTFIDKFYDDVINSPSYKPFYKFKKVEEYNDIIEIGVITKQSIEPNEIVTPGTEIEFTVSKGSQHVALPLYTQEDGVPVLPETYQKFLKDKGIESTIEKVENPDIPSGNIINLSVPDGSDVDREVVKSIIIYVAQ